jgi:hypothetical protein
MKTPISHFLAIGTEENLPTGQTAGDAKAGSLG